MPKIIIFTEEEKKRIIELYKSKSSYYICELFNCSQPIILKILKQNNIKLHPHGFFLIGKHFKYNESQKKARSESVKQSYINHPELREKRSINFKKIRQYERDSGKSEEIIKKSNETKKRRFNLGEIKAWNKGLKGDNIKKYYKNGFFPSKRKGKSYEELYGKERAKELRELFEGICSGEGNPAYLGGLSFLPYTKEFNNRFKLAIKQRDGFMCLKCGMREEDSLILFKKRLQCHHINYIKENTLKENCCALCLRCNVEVNKNRESWTKFFQSLLAERYGYKYGENQEIILEVK